MSKRKPRTVLRGPSTLSPKDSPLSRGWVRLGSTFCIAIKDHQPFSFHLLCPSQEGTGVHKCPQENHSTHQAPLRHRMPSLDKCTEAQVSMPDVHPLGAPKGSGYPERECLEEEKIPWPVAKGTWHLSLCQHSKLLIWRRKRHTILLSPI